MKPTFKRLAPFLALLAFSVTAQPQAHGSTDTNALVLRAIQTMPTGGGYKTTDEAADAFIKAIQSRPSLKVDASGAKPSFCTTATYLVFLKVLEALQKKSPHQTSTSVYDALLPPADIDSLFKDDGKNTWGRWNANGPGTAKFFYDSSIGENFEDPALRRAGDFMKIWWTQEVGGRERGHSVIYLGSRKNPKTGDHEIQYWSSNQGTGYTKVWVSISKIKHAIYSRLTHPERIANILRLPETDTYLKSCQSQDSSFEEAKRLSGVKSKHF